MSGASPGPYRQEPSESRILKKDQRIGALERELEETQECLAVERLENRLLRGMTRQKRAKLLSYGLLRFGLSRGLAAVAGATFASVLLFSLHLDAPRESYHVPAPHHTRAIHQVPTMLMVNLPQRVCYTRLTCHECIYNPFAVWTWGGEQPLPLKSYELEVTLVAFSD